MTNDVTRRQMLAVTVVTGGALLGGQLMPGVISSAAAQGAKAGPGVADVLRRAYNAKPHADW